MKKRIFNTSNKGYVETLGLGVRLGIKPPVENDERAGGQEMVVAEQLPIDGFMTGSDPAGHRRRSVEAAIFNKIFIEAGGKIGAASYGDDLFVDVTLPPGWKKQATDHALWTHLLDARGNVRAKIFYKAAFYDRSSHLAAVRRLYPSIEGEGIKKASAPVIKDSNDRTVWTGKPIAYRGYPKTMDDQQSSYDEAGCIAARTLAQAYPDYESVSAYWDVKKWKFPR